MERGNYDIDEIPLVMNIRSYMFEPLAVNNNEENTPTRSDDSALMLKFYRPNSVIPESVQKI